MGSFMGEVIQMPQCYEVKKSCQCGSPFYWIEGHAVLKKTPLTYPIKCLKCGGEDVIEGHKPVEIFTGFYRNGVVKAQTKAK